RGRGVEPEGGRRLPGRQARPRLLRGPGDEGDPRPGERGARPGGGSRATRARRRRAGRRRIPRLMGIINAALWIAGVVLIAVGYSRARGPWARYQALKEQDANAERYAAWRGGVHDEGTTGASVAMEILQRQAGARARAGVPGGALRC